MTTLNYQLWARGPERRDRDDPDSIQYNVGVLALAKRSLTNRFEVANEWLGMRLAEALNFPVPPGVPVRFGGNEYFCSLNFAGAARALPPIDFSAFVKRHPAIACGIAVFDCWICHEDRHDENVSWIENPDAKDDVINIFDHGRALLSSVGVSRLVGYEDRLPSPELAAHLETLASFDEWDNRLRRIPDEFIVKAVDAANALYGLASSDVASMASFLIRRKSKLRRLFAIDQDTKAVCKSLRPGALWRIRDDSQDAGTHDDLEYYI